MNERDDSDADAAPVEPAADDGETDAPADGTPAPEDAAGDDSTETLYVVGLLDGVAAYVAGYLSMVVVVLGFGTVNFSSGIVEPLRVIGLAFYNSFNVPDYSELNLEYTVNGSLGGGPSGTLEVVETQRQWENVITGWRRVEEQVTANGTVVQEQSQTTTFDPTLSLPAEVYLLVPVVVLLAVGIVLGYRTLDAPATQRTWATQSLLAGGLLTLGFLLAALVGTYLFVETSDSGVLRPARFETLLYGVAYPAVFGTVGAAVGQYLGKRDGA